MSRKCVGDECIFQAINLAMGFKLRFTTSAICQIEDIASYGVFSRPVFDVEVKEKYKLKYSKFNLRSLTIRKSKK